MVSRFIDSFFQEGTQVIVDPVMGDHGVRYATYTDEMCRKMGRLVAKADIITPNITESCILTDTKYQEHFDEAQLQEMCGRLHEMGPQRIVITGLDMEDGIGNYVSQNGQAELVVLKRRGKQRCGTGDIFASMIAAQAVKHVDFTESVRKAAEFIGMCIEESDRIGIPVTDGVCFEQFLGKLCE
jgi:pyridoxine kinase